MVLASHILGYNKTHGRSRNLLVDKDRNNSYQAIKYVRPSLPHRIGGMSYIEPEKVGS